jgi:hypothetical protein
MNTQAGFRTLIGTGIALATCACIARGPDDYRAVTRSLVDTKKDDIESCFGGTKGKVVINFTVEKKTGKIINVVADKERTKAPESLSKCIVDAIDGLILDPVDQRDGQATFSWKFRANEPKPAEEEAPAPNS